MLNSLIDNILKINPDLKREVADIKSLEDKNIFTHDVVIHIFVIFYRLILLK
jgi:hypothetical protein